ncbi:BTB/POZ domain-containing protein At2g04740 [Ananas comosus]|uniref:BTB/POZ domain-containing protein At2g04740 n=1 Tax=Ananas comosus TaxID=4615 RepID=A0A6P5EQK4_ANACO|nr:BTB/POZ domain-containing protein At2g04740 [Ananas comosus]
MDPELEQLDLDPEDLQPSTPLKKVPAGDLFEAARAGDVERLRLLLEGGAANVNARDRWDSVALYYACLAGHLDAARMLLEAALRHAFLSCAANRAAYLDQCADDAAAAAWARGYFSADDGSTSGSLPPDITFYVDGRPIEAHRVILSARSSFFKRKFESEWKYKKEVRFSSQKLSYRALYSLIHFFYSDRLEVAVDNMEDLARTCKACKCEELQKILQKELIHQKYAEYKSLREVDNSQKRFILQGLSLPEEDRLPSALNRILQVSLASSSGENTSTNEIEMRESGDDLADLCVKVGPKVFRCHQVILAARSEYFRARLCRMTDFLEGNNEPSNFSLPFLEEHDLSTEAFEKMIEYMYTDGLKDMDPDQAEEMFDAASRYLLFPLKRAVADVLLPHLEMVSPAELCHWLILADMYAVASYLSFCMVL